MHPIRVTAVKYYGMIEEVIFRYREGATLNALHMPDCSWRYARYHEPVDPALSLVLSRALERFHDQ